jgi:hypothetical protein
MYLLLDRERIVMALGQVKNSQQQMWQIYMGLCADTVPINKVV